MKKHLRLICLSLLLVAVAFNVYAAADNSAASPKSAPDFQLQDLNDKAVFLNDYKGKKAVVLFFWTTWCPFCREALKTLDQEYVGLAKQGIQVLAINVGEPKYKVDNFVKSRSLSFTVLLDKDSTVADAYELIGVPTYVLINKSGEIVSTGNSFPRDALKAASASSAEERGGE